MREGFGMDVLLVNSDPMMTKMVRFLLEDRGYRCHTATPSQAFAQAFGGEVDAILLEILLHEGDGFALCEALRARGYRGAIVFLSRRQDLADRLRAFEAGADDFVGWPAEPAELLARLEVAVRRAKAFDAQPLGTRVIVGDFTLDLSAGTLVMPGKPAIRLTPVELRLLECLMRNAGLTLRRETLIERVWGYDYGGDNRLEVYIRRLRRKIEPDPDHPCYLRTVRGIGYVFGPRVGTSRLDRAAFTVR